MFENPGLLLSMNMAKWQIWLACYSDLTVYLGGLVYQRVEITSEEVAELFVEIFDNSMETLGTPEDSVAEFPDTVTETRQRIANTDYASISDDETPFSPQPRSPVSLGAHR